MIPLVYDELKKLAAGHLRSEGRARPINTTALVHEMMSKTPMITRRKLLACLPFAGYAPALEAQSGVERIDTHSHIHRSAPALFAALEKANWKCLSICVSRAMGDEPSDIDEVNARTAEVHKAHPRTIAWASSFDARKFDERGFADRVISKLQRTFVDGAVAVKIWKNIGMGIRSKSGECVLPDNPAYAPVFEAIQKAGRTLIAHIAEPDGAWLPLDSFNPEIGYYGSHPEWHMYNRKDIPSKEAILAARDRLLARHPKLRVIGCHIGSDEEHLDRLAKRLDTYPNFSVDLAARVRYLMRGDRDQVKRFLIKYQDRVLYGTDFTLGSQNDEQAAASIGRTHERDWDFFATGNELEFRGRKFTGLQLPEAVLRKIFRENARRCIPRLDSG